MYRKISGLSNAEIFAATTLLVVLGTSLMTQLAGLSLALGAFLAGLLLAETEYALQVSTSSTQHSQALHAACSTMLPLSDGWYSMLSLLSLITT